MEKDEANRDLDLAAWGHVSAGRFAEAEVAFRGLLDRLGSGDPTSPMESLGDVGGDTEQLGSAGRGDRGVPGGSR